MDAIIIDRRKISGNRSLPNRKRFLDRAKPAVREAIKRAVGQRDLGDKSDVDISIPSKGLGEPRFSHDPGAGEHDYVLPGNEEYVPGDRMRKPNGGGEGGGRGNKGGLGEAEDEFYFTMRHDEYLDILFDDLELPDLTKRSQTITNLVPRRAGFTTTGAPSNLDVERTMMSSLARRIALKTPKLAAIAELEDELAVTGNAERRAAIEMEIDELRRRAATIGFLDNVDIRYRNFTMSPKPATQAVMFCVLDVSYSMGEREKIIAKKFFKLVSLFLERNYQRIDVVFIRHHESAQVCDENAFFNDRMSGGTVVSTAYREVNKMIQTHYPVSDWNIYVAQASDGDNYDTDNENVVDELGKLLPQTQYMAYIEIGREQAKNIFGVYSSLGNSSLWEVLQFLAADHPVLNCKKINDEREVVPAFRSLFAKNRETVAA